MQSRLLSLVALCLSTGCATLPARPPLHRVTTSGVSLGAVALKTPGPAPLSIYLLIDNNSAPEILVDPVDFSLGPARGSSCSPVTVEKVAAEPGSRPLYALAGQGLALRDGRPTQAPDLALDQGSLSAPERTAGVLSFPCADQDSRQPLLLRWRVRGAETGAVLSEIEVPLLPE